MNVFHASSKEKSPRLTLGLLAALAACLAFSVVAQAAPLPSGALTQLDGIAGCVSQKGSDGCAVGRGLGGAESVAVSPDGRNAYVAGYTSDSVVVLGRDRLTGVLTQLDGKSGCVNEDGGDGCAVGRGLSVTNSVTVSADGKNVYVASHAHEKSKPGSLTVFSRNPVTGALKQLKGKQGCINPTGAEGCGVGRALVNPLSVTASDDGKNVYLVSWFWRDFYTPPTGALAVFSRDSATGALTQLQGSRGCVNKSGNQGCLVARGLLDPVAATVSSDGRNLYLASWGVRTHKPGSLTIFKRDLATGALTQLSGKSGCLSEDGFGGQCSTGRGIDGVFAVTGSWGGSRVYVGSWHKALATFDRDPESGALHQPAGAAGCIAADVATTESDHCSMGRGLLALTSLAVSPDDENIYSASFDSFSSDYEGAIAAFGLDINDRGLDQLSDSSGCLASHGVDPSCSPARAIAGAFSIAISPDGKNAYVAGEASDAVAVFKRERNS